MKRAIFLDRDGVICKEKNLFYKGKPITKPDDFEWIPNSKTAISVISELDFVLAIATNQSIINKGKLNVRMFHEINTPLYEEFKKNNLEYGVYFCPHLKEESCNCRKPNMGMLLNASKDFDLALNNSYFIGDSTSDMKAGENAGCKTILVKTGYAGGDNKFKIKPDYVVRDLLEASYLIKSFNEK